MQLSTKKIINVTALMYDIETEQTTSAANRIAGGLRPRLQSAATIVTLPPTMTAAGGTRLMADKNVSLLV